MLTENHDPSSSTNQTVIGLLISIVTGLGAYINFLRAKISKQSGGRSVPWEAAMREMIQTTVRESVRETVAKEIAESEDLRAYGRRIKALERIGDERERDMNLRLDGIERSQDRMESQLKELAEGRT